MDGKSFLGIDVGTGSARAGLFDGQGRLLGSAVEAIKMFNPAPEFAEQSSDDIWGAVCRAVKQVMASTSLCASDVGGIGFDATCSLVAVGPGGVPVSVSPTGKDVQNIIVWMDHRAIVQTDIINATRADVLKYVGGTMSPEMELPKLLWLKENLPESYKRATDFFDLPDWLVHRATGSKIRSFCSATCKWTYRASMGANGEGWDTAFLTEIGLKDLADNQCRAIGQKFLAPGEPVGKGLLENAAGELSLLAGTPVAASLIDAYSGALGTLGAGLCGGALAGRMALVAGTSTCHIGLMPDPSFADGVWGPYNSALVPGLWVSEAGQSAAGALIDRIIESHPAHHDLVSEARKDGVSIYGLLDQALASASGNTGDCYSLTKDYHVQPDFHGNRAPLADPTRRGAITGLSLQAGRDDLARQYLATIQALAYGTRQIIDGLEKSGAPTKALVASGGLARNWLYIREHADATGCPVIIPRQQESVLLGSAMLGAVAAGHHGSLQQSMAAMSGPVQVVNPRGGKVAAFHNQKFRVFEQMQADFLSYRNLMNG